MRANNHEQVSDPSQQEMADEFGSRWRTRSARPFVRPSRARPSRRPPLRRGMRRVIEHVDERMPGVGSEYVRWVQSALNDILNLRLPVDGVMSRETRSAVRSFQEKRGLPADGYVGPDTERAIISARGAEPSSAGDTKPSESDTMDSAPSSEDREWANMSPHAGAMLDMLASEFEEEAAPASKQAQNQSTGDTCSSYTKGESTLSKTQQGHLPLDVFQLPRGLLIADFGVGNSEIKQAAKNEKLLRDWLSAAKADLLSIVIRIYGYSDCVGEEKNNVALRQARAASVFNLLGKDLQSRVDYAGAAQQGAQVADNTTAVGRAKNRGVIIELLRLPEEIIHITGTAPSKSPVPTDTRPKPVIKKPHRSPPPPIKQKPKPTTGVPAWPWRPPRVTTPFPSSDPRGPSWVWGAIGLASAALGAVVSIGVRSLSQLEVAEIIDAAWLVFQLEGGLPLRTVMGMAGEAAAEKLMARVLGVDAAKILNLNKLVPNFPVADIISPRGLASVKVKGLLGAGSGTARNLALAREYIQDLVDLAGAGGPRATRKLGKAASILYDNRAMLQGRGQWPAGFNPRSVAEIEQYIRDKTTLFIPNDHVTLVKKTIGEVLYKRVKSGNIRLPAGVDAVKWVNSFVDRVAPIGLNRSDFDILLEAAKHIPKEQIPRLHRELIKLSQMQRKP